MKELAVLEIKMYALIRKLNVLYDGDMEKVEKYLYDVISHKDSEPSYINEWIQTRYVKIKMSKETQILMLRHAGFTYRQIALFTNKAPNTIKSTLDMYDFNYKLEGKDLAQLELLNKRWEVLEKQLQQMGLELL